MRHLFGFILLFVFTNSLSQQTIGIGTNAPNQNAILDVYDTAKGVLLPRISREKRLQLPNVRGMVVYDTTTANYWWNDGAAWVNIPGKGTQLGEMIYWDGSLWKAIPPGKGGQVLTMQVESLVPGWSGPYLPIVSTVLPYEVKSTSFKSGGSISDSGRLPIIEKGLLWATSPNFNPSVANKVVIPGSSSQFNSQIIGLQSSFNYYVRAFATNAIGTAYGLEQNLTTPSTSSPTVGSIIVNSVTPYEFDINSRKYFSASFTSEVINDNGSSVTERGFTWRPDIFGTTYVGTGTGTMTGTLSDLPPGTDITVRAFAKNANGITYSDPVIVKTTIQPPSVYTGDTSKTTAISFEAAFSLTASNGAMITEKGIVWSTQNNPTIADFKTNQVNSLSSTGIFYSANISNLTPNTKYYYRAYGINSAGVGYGDVKEALTKSTTPSVTTAQLSSVTSNSAISGGNVTSDGGQTVTARGIVWSTSPGPITALTTKTVNGSGTGSFSATMTGLSPNTVYYVRSYATNALGTSYGNELSFTTSQ